MLAVERNESAARGTRENSTSLPDAGKSVRTDAAHARPHALDAPCLARRHSRHEAIAISGIQLQEGGRRDPCRRRGSKSDAECAVTGADSAVPWRRPVDAAAARAVDPPRAHPRTC